MLYAKSVLTNGGKLVKPTAISVPYNI